MNKLQEVRQKQIRFNLPRNTSAPSFERSEWGGRFPQSPYFPLYLGNGVDAMLINISGSGDGHWELPPYSADVIGKLHNIGWYKAGRRVVRDDLKVYGSLYCMMEFSACPLVDGEALVPQESKQWFDPLSATLTTIYRQSDNRTGVETELQIRTFLTSGSLLVQEIHVLSAPECGISYAFTQNTASCGHLNTQVPAVFPDDCRFMSLECGATVRAEIQWESNRAVYFSTVIGAAVKDVRTREIPAQKFVEWQQRTGIIHKGETIWRVIGLFDSKEGQNPEALAAEAFAELSSFGIRRIRDAHQLEWNDYFSSSSVTVPDPAVQYIYNTSRYLLKATHHPSGFQPMGNLPYLWQGAMFWDASFVADAFLGANNTSLAAESLSFLKHFLPECRELARVFGNSGGRLEWTVHPDSFSVYPEPCRQFHNNAVWALSICKLLAAEPGRADAAEFLAFAEELIRFLRDEVMRNQGTGDVGANLVGIDESYETPKSNDTWTIAVISHAIREFEIVSKIHGYVHTIKDLDSVKSALDELLTENIDKDGVLQSFNSGRIPHWGSLVFDLMPGHPSALPTLAKMTALYNPEHDCYNFHGLSRYADLAFPWANFWMARCLARNQSPLAFDFFMNATRHCNYFGGLPERIYYHGEHYISWLNTAHAALVWALHGMMGHSDRGIVHLLTGINLERWPDLEVDSIYIGEGIAMRLCVRNKKITQLALENRKEIARTVNISHPQFSRENPVQLKPGWNTII